MKEEQAAATCPHPDLVPEPPREAHCPGLSVHGEVMSAWACQGSARGSYLRWSDMNTCLYHCSGGEDGRRAGGLRRGRGEPKMEGLSCISESHVSRRCGALTCPPTAPQGHLLVTWKTET